MPKKTPLYDEHLKAGARLIDFGGFDMPVQYSGIKQEHMAVRESAGLFDVSHMGEFFVTGNKALELIQKVTVGNMQKLKPGKAKYTVMCYENGGIIDDLIVYMLGDEEYMLVVNASNIDKDFSWIEKQNSMGASVENRSDEIALLALQGPESENILKKITGAPVNDIGFYSFKRGTVAEEQEIIISATGYTGEKGFELYIDTTQADPVRIWAELLKTGKSFGLEPAGLGARDTLRLEMGYALYGNDISKETTPIEARLGWLIDFDKEHFIGKEVLQEQKKKGVSKKLMGFIMAEPRRVPRHGYSIHDGRGSKIGTVTSGTQSVSLDEGIGMGYIPTEKASENKKIYINIRGKNVEAIVVKPPFLNK